MIHAKALLLQAYFESSTHFYYVLANKAGGYIAANPLFINNFIPAGQPVDGLSFFENSLPADGEFLQQQIAVAAARPAEKISFRLRMQLQNATDCYVQWEMTAVAMEGTEEHLLECVGYLIPQASMHMDAKEDYSVFVKNNIETIWSFELKIPVPVFLSPAELIEHCREHGYLAECNETMARLYGVEKPADLFGKKLDYLLDLHNQANIDFLNHFFTNNFQATAAESQEKDVDGNTRYFTNSLMGIVEDGYLKRVWGSHREITDRKLAEKALMESEKRFRDVANTAPVIIWMSDTENKLVYVNPSWVEFTGITAEKLKPNSWECLIHPEDVEKTVAAYNHAFNLQQPITLVYRLLRCNGEYSWVQETSMPRKLDDGKFIGYIGSIIDINDQKRKEEQLRNQGTILNNVFDIIVSTEVDGTIKSWNKIAESFYELKEEDVIGKNVVEVLSLDYHKVSREEAVHELFSKGSWKGEISFINKKGERKYLLNTITVVKNDDAEIIGVVTIGKDITERKIAEQQLEQSELFYRNLIANSLDGMLIVNEEGLIRFSSPSVQNILGYTPAEIVGHNSFSFVHPQDFNIAFESFNNEVNEAPKEKSIVVRLKNRDGDWIWCMVRAHNLLKNPHVKGIVIYFYDDTQRTEARAALKESEARFRNMISDLQMGVMVLNAKLEIILCNKYGLELLGYREAELIGKSTAADEWDMIDENGQAISAKERPSATAFRTKKPVKDFVMGVRQFNTANRIWVITNAVPVLDESGHIIHVITSITDITERKKLQEKIFDEEVNKQRLLTQATIDGQEKERKEIGKELHDNLGQQLTTIKLFLDMAKSTADEATLEMVNMGIKGISDVINEIRNMSRSLVPPSLGDLGLVDSVKELCYSLKRTQTFNIRFYHNSFEEGKLKPNQSLMIYRIIQEQLNNIIKHSQAKSVILHLSTEFDFITLDISDNGKGFDLAKSKKGLGLLNIINRAELFNGKVDIQTQVGKGCKLRVTVPLFAEGVLN